MPGPMLDHVTAVRARIEAIQSRFPDSRPAAAMPTAPGVVAPAAFAATLTGMLPTGAAGAMGTPGMLPVDASPLRPFDPSAEGGSSGGAETYEPLIAQASARYGVDASLIRAVVQAESGFQPQAVSRTGAQGLMQLMPSTARALGVNDPLDPAQNIDGGARYLRHLLDKFGDPSLAIAAYNAGPASVEKYHGIPPYSETQSYVERVQNYWRGGGR